MVDSHAQQEAVLGTPREHHESIDSTNRRALELAAAGASHGTMVTATEQTAGHGREGRSWTSPANTSLSMSLVIRDPSPLLSLAAAVAVAETVDRLWEEQPQDARAMIKWPADILVDGRKVAGILVESHPRQGWAVLGIGINVAVPEDAFPEEMRGRAGTLGLTSEAIEPALDVLLKRLTYWLNADAQRIVRAMRSRDVLKGQRITWPDGAGTAAGIDLDGQLMVDLGDGIEDTVAAGEVHLVHS